MGTGSGGAGAGQLMAGAALQPARGDLPCVVEELHDRAALAALLPEWERLLGAMAEARLTRGPFLRPEWFAIFAAALSGERRASRLGELKLLVAHRGGQLVAVLPLVSERRRLAGLPARLLRSLTDDHSARFDLIVDPACATVACQALVGHLLRMPHWDALELQSVPSEHAAADRLIDLGRAAGLATGDWDSMRSPYLELPADEAALDARLGSKLRGNLRRRARKLAATLGPLCLERIDGGELDGGKLNAALDEGFALEAAGWKGARGTAIACNPGLTARYRALAHAFAARGELACYFLRAGDRRVAFHFALVDQDTYYLFKPGYDPALASYGLGHLLVDLVARDLIARGMRTLDFLGDDLPWKRDWTDTVRPQRFRYLFAPTPRGRALATWKLHLAPTLRRWSSRIHKR